MTQVVGEHQPAIIVTDTSVLINFLRIDRTDLLAGHSHAFLATDHVAAEITDRYPDQQQRFAAALAAGRSASAGQANRKRLRYVHQLEERIERHNRDVILHNLKAPRGIPHRSMLKSDQLIKQALAKAKREA